MISTPHSSIEVNPVLLYSFWNNGRAQAAPLNSAEHCRVHACLSDQKPTLISKVQKADRVPPASTRPATTLSN